jgi:hypothetical protein
MTTPPWTAPDLPPVRPDQPLPPAPPRPPSRPWVRLSLGVAGVAVVTGALAAAAIARHAPGTSAPVEAAQPGAAPVVGEVALPTTAGTAPGAEVYAFVAETQQAALQLGMAASGVGAAAELMSDPELRTLGTTGDLAAEIRWHLQETTDRWAGSPPPADPVLAGSHVAFQRAAERMLAAADDLVAAGSPVVPHEQALDLAAGAKRALADALAAIDAVAVGLRGHG